jgi:NADH dehydrogenase
MARVFITGGSGFVGSAVIDELLRRNHDVIALQDHRPVDARGGSVRIVNGSLFDTASLDQGIKGVEAVIHLVGIIMEHRHRGVTFERIHFEGFRNVVDATVRKGVKRYLHMSALGTRPDAVSDYHKTKFRAEEYVRSSGLDWTIFRPSFIHGPRGEFMQMQAKWARGKAPPFMFMPYFGAGVMGRGGAGNLQPVYVGDVARAFVDALEKPATVGEIYPLGGTDVVSWPQMHHIVSKAIVGRERAAVALPAWYAKAITHVVPAPLLPFNRDQVIMSQEDNTCDLSKFVSDFGWTPRPFEETVKSYAGAL